MDLFKFCRTYSKANRPFCPLNQIIVGIINVYHVYSLSPHFTFFFSFFFFAFCIPADFKPNIADEIRLLMPFTLYTLDGLMTEE